jgi:Flp pilus assembly protein TadD
MTCEVSGQDDILVLLSMKINKAFADHWMAIAVICIVVVAGSRSFGQNDAEGQLPSHPQPQASPASPQTPRTAPSTETGPSTPAKPAASVDASAIPAAAERHYHAGRVAEKDKDPETAIAEYRAAVQEYSDYVDARYRLANLLMDQQAYSDAIAELRQVVMLRPDDANARNDLGFALKKNGDAKGAAAEYLQAIRLNPKMAVAQNNLANLLYANKQ